MRTTFNGLIFSTTVCFAIAFMSVGIASADIPIDEVEPNNDCDLVQVIGVAVSGDPFVVSGRIEPFVDIHDAFGFYADPGLITITLYCADDLDVYLGTCEEEDFIDVAHSVTYDCPEVISGYFTEAGEWGIWVDGSWAGDTNYYTLIVSWNPCQDADGDGFADEACGGDDCDDTDVAVNPGAEEICDDQIDNDCDSLIDLDDPDCVSTPGDDCGNPHLVTLPVELDFLDTNHTCGRGDDYADTCLGSYDGGEDILYELTVTETVSVQITLDPNGTAWAGFCLDDSCPPDDSCLATSTSTGAAPSATDCLELEPGTYTIMVDTWAPPDCIEEFDLLIEACEICPDADADGYEDAACGGPDCDDTNPDTYPGAVEDCFDTIDNDCDGLADGDDDECACDIPDLMIECGATVTGTTIGGVGVLSRYPGCATYEETGPEVIYSLTLDKANRLTITLSDLSADLDLYLLADAGGEACVNGCLAYSAATVEEVIDFDAGAGIVHIVVDGYSGAESDFTLSVECCVDADGDGFFDEACSGDDCDDTDALVYPGAGEICDDLVDNDCDGLVDDVDPDCIVGFTLELDAFYEAGELGMAFTAGTPAEATWQTFLVLTYPEFLIIPIWSALLPAIDPPLDFLVSLPFPSLEWTGIYSVLITDVVEALAFKWVFTGAPE